MKIAITSYISLPIRIYIGAIFLLACYHKILSPSDFALDIATYDILPLFLVNIMALVLPWLELFTAVLLIVGFKTRTSSFLISCMMLMFLLSILIAISKGIDMSCGCFASNAVANDDPISFDTVLRDVIWLLMSLFVLFFDRTPIGADYLLLRRKNYEKSYDM